MPVPLPVRDGLNPTRVRLPVDGSWPTVRDYLFDRFPEDRVRLQEKIDSAEIVNVDGRPVKDDTAYAPDAFIWLYRDPLPEKRIPFEIEILHQDDDLLVIDKPHFLATSPRGMYITESAVVRLRILLGQAEISPAHRLDRATAGVLVFTKRREVRGAYQQLFARRQVLKEYEAVAPFAPGLEFPLEIRSHIIKERGTPTARVLPEPPNSHSRVELLGVCGDIAHYRLLPSTGKTHQLRLHLSSLGIPILGDHFYPHLYEVPADDFSKPLQLLARAVEFADPFTGVRRRFQSSRQLASWPQRSTGG